jgi:hypothetical protein
MADQRIKELNDDYKAVLKTVNDIQRQEETALEVGKELSKQKKQLLKDSQRQLSLIESLIKKEEQRLQIQENEERELKSIATSYLKIDASVKNQLGNGRTYLTISSQIAREKARESLYEGKNTEFADRQRRNIEIRSSILGDIASSQLSQAEATQAAEDSLRGTTSFEKQRLNLEANRQFLTQEQYQEALRALQTTEDLYRKEQQLLTLKEGQQDLYNAIPDSIRGAVDFGSVLITKLKTAGVAAMGVAVLSGALIASVALFQNLDQAASDFAGETGLALSQIKDIKLQSGRILGDFRNLGLESQDIYNIQKELVGVFGDSARFSDSIVGSQAVLAKNFGVSNQAAAKTLQIFQSLGGVSENTAASLQLQTVELARQAGVAPAQVLQDISESSDSIYGAFRGNSEELVKQAVQARRLGTNLKDVLETTDKLLDFESSITQELEASAFVGGQFNLSQARALRAAGDIAGAQEEILRQLQRSGDFRQQDVFTQRALAEAAGMTVDEITRQLTTQDKLNSLSAEQKKLAEDAISQGLDISNINEDQLASQVKVFAAQKEQQATLQNIQNSFQGLITSVGQFFLPLMNGVAKVFEFISSNLAGMVGFATSLVTLFGVIYGIKLKTFALAKMQAFAEARAAGKSVIGAIASIFQGQGKLPIIGAVIAATMVGALFAALSKASSFAGDLNSPATGKTMVSTKEGGLFELSPNDDLIAAPGASRALQNMSQGGGSVVQPINMVNQSDNTTDKLISTIERLEKAYMRGAQVNLDGQKVIRGLGRVGNETTQNNFSLV